MAKLSDEVIKAYEAPYPDESYKAGARIFPALVPTTPEDPESDNNKKVWYETLAKWEKPLLTLFSDSDPITKGGDKIFQKIVPGAKGQPHVVIEGAGHFLQEDKGEELTEHIINFVNMNN